ncbi:hypothetical protein SNEBB_001354 [Seison nebaliae]|nr:hypothetical protein SNEBB_001354 [Seison nebaliae]
MKIDLLMILVTISIVQCDRWPVPYQRYESRPTNDPYCQAGVIPFCPDRAQYLPIASNEDEIDIFALKKPVWQFKFGDLLGKLNIIHDAIGFYNRRTKLNYTMEWYELDQIFNCTFAHTREDSNITWCNQGALCLYDGIDDDIWLNTTYGVLKNIGRINGKGFNQFLNWTTNDNRTGPFYFGWTNLNSSDDKSPTTQTFFEAFDCASYVLRALKNLRRFGAQFEPSSFNYTLMHIYSKEPKYLDLHENIFGPTSINKQLMNSIWDFYYIFRPLHLPLERMNDSLFERIMKILKQIIMKKTFFIYFNDAYWHLNLTEPYFDFKFKLIPLPI